MVFDDLSLAQITKSANRQICQKHKSSFGNNVALTADLVGIDATSYHTGGHDLVCSSALKSISRSLIWTPRIIRNDKFVILF